MKKLHKAVNMRNLGVALPVSKRPVAGRRSYKKTKCYLTSEIRNNIWNRV